MDISKKRESNESNEDVDADAILAELEAEEYHDISVQREQRASELTSASHAAVTATVKQDRYATLKSDDDALRYTTEHERAIVHFYHPDFARCSIMDEHLTMIADQHTDYSTGAIEGQVAFARVDVNHAEFIVQKLGIRVLPCVIGFVDGQIMGRIVGFEGVSWGGQEKGLTVTRAIEERFVEWKLLRKCLVRRRDDDSSEGEDEPSSKGGRRGISGRKQQVEDEDDDWD